MQQADRALTEAERRQAVETIRDSNSELARSIDRLLLSEHEPHINRADQLIKNWEADRVSKKS